ncbi:MAG: helix-turn-helix domain-containing protein [Bacteroidales bacterium]|nr:helix-turn-helix domain-containing protein [Bacteroidales bacterium]
MCDLNIKEIRKNLSVSQTKFAEMLGVHIRTVQNWESGGVIPQAKYTLLRNLQNQSKEKQKTQDPQPDERLCDSSADYLASANREIQLLRQRIADLERTIHDKEEIIRLLKQKL